MQKIIFANNNFNNFSVLKGEQHDKKEMDAPY